MNIDIRKYLNELKFEIQAIFFDWGNTLMKFFPGQESPMATWDNVAAIDGVLDILPCLQNNYRLFVLSNATDSDKNLLKLALRRINIDLYFSDIFTAHELKTQKPAPDFYLKALASLKIMPEKTIMIGDDYENDIIGAKQAGLWTIWFNPSRKIPNTHYPYHDFEIASLTEIPSIMTTNFKNNQLKSS